MSHSDRGPIRQQKKKLCAFIATRLPDTPSPSPLTLGAILAGASKKDLEMLTKLGETIGMIFQIKDDELNLFGDEAMMGKSIGSDVREGKKTLYYYHLFQKSDGEIAHRLHGIFGNHSLTSTDLAYLKESIKKLGVNKIIEEKINMLEEKSKRYLEELQIAERDKATIYELMFFVTSRAS